MNDDTTMLKYVSLAVLAAFLCVLLFGCSRTVYIPVESTKTEYIDRIKQDSVHILDSVIIRDKGDTIFLTRWRTEYRDRLLRDSVFIRDSIQVPFPVEKKLTRWQSVKMDLGGIVIGSIFVLLIIVIWLIFKKR